MVSSIPCTPVIMKEGWCQNLTFGRQGDGSKPVEVIIHFVSGFDIFRTDGSKKIPEFGVLRSIIIIEIYKGV